MGRGFKLRDKIIFINNNPRFNSDNIIKGHIGTIITIDYNANEDGGMQSLCVDWQVSNRKHWWTFSTDVRLAKPEELS